MSEKQTTKFCRLEKWTLLIFGMEKALQTFGVPKSGHYKLF